VEELGFQPGQSGSRICTARWYLACFSIHSRNAQIQGMLCGGICSVLCQSSNLNKNENFVKTYAFWVHNAKVNLGSMVTHSFMDWLKKVSKHLEIVWKCCADKCIFKIRFSMWSYKKLISFLKGRISKAWYCKAQLVWAYPCHARYINSSDWWEQLKD